MHLGALRDNVDERLRARGRQEWAAEECERLSEVRYAAPDPETAFLSVKGAGRLDGPALAESLNAYSLPGVRFEAVAFTPTDAGDGKFEGQQVQGVRLVQETTNYDAPKAAVAMLLEAYGMSGDNWSWSEDHFDRLAGTDLLRLGIEAGQDFAALTAAWDEGVRAFEQLRRPYLIY